MQRQLDDDIRCADLQALPESLCRAAVHIALDTGHTSGIDDQMVTKTEAWEDVPDGIDIPAHEVDPSHEGREYFHFIDTAQDSLARKRRNYYRPSKHERVSIRHQAWEAQMPVLFMAYMIYKFGPSPDAPNVVNATFFNISVLGMQGYDVARSLPHNQGHDHLNETLIIHRFLGTSPAHPTLAIPIPTLELYRRCRLRCPQLSIQQWVKVLCDLANINYHQAIRDQFSDAFDTYLEILRHVDQAIKLQADANQLAGDTELNPSMMGALDGNNSLKCDYFLSHKFVNHFKDEVKRKVWQPGTEADVKAEGDLTDGHSVEATCADRWRAATLILSKGYPTPLTNQGYLYRAKYPLATISRLMETLPKGIGLGYDIACSFWSTLMRSSLGPQARELGVRMVVPAFHEHAHNRLCQLCFHIQISKGFGIEDLETCELARLTWHLTPYHRRQFIDMYFRHWDSEKYEGLGRNVSYAQYTGWLSDEHKYLESKHSEPENDVLGVEYIKLLTKYGEARQIWEAAQKLSAQAMRAKDMAHLCQVSQDAWDGVNFLQQKLQKVEGHLDIGARWTPESLEFLRAAEYLRIQGYQCAVDKLEGLVVQRLFELTKVNVSHTGYKQRTHITKALKACSKAIQQALQAYNKAALTLDPPRPSLAWAQIVEYTTITEFELLHMGAQEDI
ncbi:hypothetical protein K439DRAFT_1624875 [Ramaria rubella]|nr:hypothetical protein K439DRAFT_1624875 [Ramaria rubella]